MNRFTFKRFLCPENEWRPMPFWFWNDTLNADILESQVEHFSQMGYGGFFIHARFGLETEYMSEDWFTMVKLVILAAEKRNMWVWIYDENLFPSGISCLAQDLTGDYRPKYIDCQPIDNKQKALLAEGSFMIEDKSSEISQLVDILDTEGYSIPFRDTGSRGVHCESRGAEWIVCINTLRGKTIFGVDYMHAGVAQAYIESTHEIYKRHIGKWFGSTVKGFFTDEPTLLPWHHDIAWYKKRNNGRCIPYTPELLDEMKKHGIDCSVGQLAYTMMVGGDNAAEIRKIYWTCVQALYVDNFFIPYFQWCEENNLLLTGHVLLEEGLYFNHIFQAGPLKGLSCMHIPGVDQLTKCDQQDSMSYMVQPYEHIPQVKTNVTGVKLVSSIAHAANRQRVLSECFGVGGWDMKLADIKRVTDWLFVLGVNLICPHAVFYSIKGFRKFDAPACHMRNYNVHNYRLFTDYAARISYALSMGTPLADIALLYPSGAFEYVYTVGQQNSLDKRISDLYDTSCIALLQKHVAYEIITEDDLDTSTILGCSLRIGKDKKRYTCLVVISRKGLSNKLLNLLKLFEQNDGLVLTLDEALSCDIITVETVRAYISSRLGEKMESDIRGDGSDNIYLLSRHLSDHFLHFIYNTSSAQCIYGTITNTCDDWNILNAETGQIEVLAKGEKIALNAKQSVLIYGSEKLRMITTANIPEKNMYNTIELPSDQWCFLLDGDNTLPLRNWIFSMDSNNMTSLYYYDYSLLCHTDDLHATLLLDNIRSSNNLMGKADVCVYVNDKICPLILTNEDQMYEVYDIANLQYGENHFHIVIKNSAWSGEPVLMNSPPLLKGKFITKELSCPIIEKDIGTTGIGTWEKLGYPFYSGYANYETVCSIPISQEVFLDIDEVYSTVSLIIDNEYISTRAWPPWSFSIPPKYHDRMVRIVLKCENTLANRFGQPIQSGIEGLITLRWIAGTRSMF